MAKSNNMKIKTLNYLLRNITETPPSAIYVGLFSSNPTAANTGTEVAYDGYARKQVTFSAPTNVSGVVSVTNSNEVIFPVVPANSGSLSHIGLFTASTGGDLIYYGTLPTTYALNEGVHPVLIVNSLKISED